MSVDLQAPNDHQQFGINSTQFEEIVSSRDKGSSHSNLTPRKEAMDEESDLDERLDKEESKEKNKSTSKSDYSSDGHNSYEDDFEESETPSPKKVQQKVESRKPSPRRSRLSHSSRSVESSPLKSPSIVSPRSSRKSKITKSKTYKAYKSPRSSSPASFRQPERNWSKPKNKSANLKVSRLDQTVVDRVLSANRHKVQKLESRLTQLVKELSEERDENKTLRQIHYRQEKELMRVNNEEAELPRLLTKHTTEVKSLRERIRRLQETTVQKENKLNDQDKEILKLKDRCKHYKELCEMKNLIERAELQKKLTQTENNLEKRDSEISKLQRMLNLKEKAHSRHLKEQKEKLRETQAKLNEMEENYSNLLHKLKEKERQLDYTNIYQRQIVLKEKNNTSLEALPKMAALPAPKDPKPKTKKTKKNNNTDNSNYNYLHNKEKNEEKEGGKVNRKPDSFFLTAHSDTGSDKDIGKSGMVAETNDKRLSITDGSDVSDMVMSTINKEKTLLEDELANENERRNKEEFERSLREEEERLKKEKEQSERKMKEEEERAKIERVEREAKWREGLARKEREEEERREESARLAREEEERKKAEERKSADKAEDKETKGRADSFYDEDEESRKKKDLLLARLKAIDNDKVSDEDRYHSDSKMLSNGKSGDESIKSRAFRKSGHETRQADENLHNGLPAVGKESSITSPPMSVKSDPDSIVGIPRRKPVLIGRGNLTKKNSSFSWLEDNKKPVENNRRVKHNDDFSFGDYSPTMSDSKKKTTDLNGDIFYSGLSRKPGHGRRREGGMGDSEVAFSDPRGSDNVDKSKTQNILPFLSEDFNNNEPLLPRRKRAQGRTGPAISTVFDDTLDDDIEELAL